MAPLIMGLTVSYVLHKDCKIYKKEEILTYCLSFLFLVLSYGLYREIGDSFLFTSNEDIVMFMFEKSFIYVTSLVLFFCLYLFFNYSYVTRNFYLFSKFFKHFYLNFETILSISFIGLLLFRVFPSQLNLSAVYIIPLLVLIYLYFRGFRGIILRKTLAPNYFKIILFRCLFFEIVIIVINAIINYFN